VRPLMCWKEDYGEKGTWLASQHPLLNGLLKGGPGVALNTQCIFDDISICVMMYNEKALKPIQTWLTSFPAICRYTTFGMTSAAALW
jgi:hypothetical protein